MPAGEVSLIERLNFSFTMRLWKLLLVLAAVEICAGVWTLLAGPFVFAIAGVPVVRSNDPWKVLAIGAWLAALSAWLRNTAMHGAESSRASAALRAGGLAALIATQIIFVVPLLLPGFVPGHDVGAHLTYSDRFHRSITQGQFPVRWTEWFTPGLGQPLFNYYQVGFYYLVEVVRLAATSFTIAFKTTIVLIWAAGTGFSLLALRRHGWLPAALGAVLFASSSYVLLDVYVRAALPEFTAICAAVGLVWTIGELARAPRLSTALAHAVLVCVLLASHLPASLIVAPTLAGFTVLKMWTEGGGARGVLFLAASTVLGAALATFYVLPAIGELDFIAIRTMVSGEQDFHQNFVSPALWFETSWGYAPLNSAGGGQMSVQISPVQWLCAGLALVTVLFGPRTSRADRAELTFWLLVFAGAAFMTTRWSATFWDSVPSLAYVQFPWRFLMLPAIATAMMAAPLARRVSRERTRAFVFVSVLLFQLQMTHDYRAAAVGPARISVDFDADHWWQASETTPSMGYREQAYNPISRPRDVQPAFSRWSIVEGTASLNELSSEDTETLAAVTSSEPSTVRVAVAAFPGWTMKLDGAEVPARTLPDGYLGVAVPPGRHVVEARFNDTRLRAISNVISLTAGIVWVLVALWLVGRKSLTIGSATRQARVDWLTARAAAASESRIDRRPGR